MSAEKISRVDHAWLRMDNERNWMIITGLMTFDSPLTVESLQTVLENSLLLYPRFRQRLSWEGLPGSRPFWVEDTGFRLENHIQRIDMPIPANRILLQELISRVMQYGLSYSQPLWRFYLVEHYGQGSALIARLHHSLADGIALVRVLLGMTDEFASMRQAALPDSPSQDQGSSSGLQRLEDAATAMRGLAKTGRRMLFDQEYALGQIQFAANIAQAAARLALRPPDPRTIFKGPLGIEKRAALSDPLDLEEIKQVGNVFDATINDILLTIIAGAMRRYIESRRAGDDRGKPSGKPVRGLIPVNLRQKEDSGLGNQFGLIFVSLPIGIENPVERLKTLKSGVDRLKATPEALTSYWILGLLGSLPAWAQQISVSIFDAKSTTIITNVPGPRQELHIAGAPVNTLMAWVPQSGRVGIGFSIISYNGKVWVGINGDQNQVPDPEAIVSAFEDEFEALKQLALAEAITKASAVVNAVAKAATSADEKGKAAVLVGSRSVSIQALISQVDGALHTVDNLLEEKQNETRPTCAATTRAGSPCKNLAAPGSDYCRVHQAD